MWSSCFLRVLKEIRGGWDPQRQEDPREEERGELEMVQPPRLLRQEWPDLWGYLQLHLLPGR